uniref:Uncharacterized protein n=1 Tax=Triticum urartu TaxID=4572 RepID=A0A8R7U3I0_TRIUA
MIVPVQHSSTECHLQCTSLGIYFLYVLDAVGALPPWTRRTLTWTLTTTSSTPHKIPMLLLVVVGEVTLEGAEASSTKEKNKRTYHTAAHRCSPRWLDHLCCAAADTGGGRGDHRRCSPRPPWDLGEGAIAAAALGEAAATAALREEA